MIVGESMFGGIRKKKLSLKTKVKIGISLIVLLVAGTLGAFFFLEDTLYSTVLKNANTEEDVGTKGRPIYDATLQPTAEITGTTDVTLQDMIDAGMTASEAQITAALEQILGGSIEEKIGDYLDLKNEFRVKTIAPQIVPAISAELKYGVNCDLTIMQSLSELGWNYKAAGINKKTSPAWEYNNAHGIKVGSSEPNEYWDGSSQTVGTHEYYGGNKVNIRDEFKAFKSLWHGYMYHSWMITQTKRYKPLKMQDVTTPSDYAAKLRSVGYYTAPLSYYTNLMNSIYKTNNLARLRTLYDQVVEVLARNGGLQMTPSGQTLGNGEWVPNNSGKESWGYFMDPAKGRLTSDGGVRIHPITGIRDGHYAWDYAAPTGTPVYAVRSGTVHSTTSGYGGGYGNSVVIDHGDGYYTRYAHFSKKAVAQGDVVKQGDVIGYVGSTGRSTGPHLHFEIMKGGTSKKRNYVEHANFYNGKEGGQYSLKSSKISFKDYMEQVKTGSYTGSTGSTNASNNINQNSTYNNANTTTNASSGDLSKVGNITITRDLVTNTKSYRQASNRSIQYIVIHDTGSRVKGADAKATARYFRENSDGRNVSAHYIVDDHSIYQSVAVKDIAHHAGDKKRSGLGNANIGNSNTIGIEMAVNTDGDWRKTQTNTQMLTKALMEKYKIPISNVVRHYDVSGKQCPAKLMEEQGGWERWKQELANMSNPSTGSSNSVTTPSNTSSGSVVKRTKYAGFDWAEKWDVDLSKITNKRLSILKVADAQLGKPYVYGANGPNSFDCSGLTSYCYKNGPGIDIPRNSDAQQSSSKFVEIPIDKAKPGDLFGRPGHVGIFLKDLDSKSFLALHASNSSKPILVEKYPKYDRGQVKFYRLK